MLNFQLGEDELFEYSSYPKTDRNVFYNSNLVHYPMFLPFDKSSKVIKNMIARKFESEDQKFSMNYRPDLKTDKAKKSYEFNLRYPTNSYLPLWEDHKILSILLSKYSTRFDARVEVDVRDIGRALGYGDSYLTVGSKNFTEFKMKVLNSLEKWACVMYDFTNFRYNIVKNGRVIKGNRTMVQVGNVVDHFGSSKWSTTIKLMFGAGFLDCCFHSYCTALDLDIELTATNALAGYLIWELKSYEKNVVYTAYGREIPSEPEKNGEDVYYRIGKEKLLERSGFGYSSYTLKEKLVRLDSSMGEACRQLKMTCKHVKGNDRFGGYEVSRRLAA